MDYQIHHNQTSWFMRPYEPGDVLTPGYRGEFPACFQLRTDIPLFEAMERLAELVFAKHNRDDRPDRFSAPSLSLGDVITIGEIAFAVDRIGFKRVDLTAADIAIGPPERR